MRALKRVQFFSRSKKTKILTTGIHVIFRGLKFESDTEIGQKGTFFKALAKTTKDFWEYDSAFKAMPWLLLLLLGN